MKYVLLLRAVNVGGNFIIKMIDLKKAIEKCGFTNVRTYIQSGNVIFESAEENVARIAAKLEAALSRAFNLDSRLILKSYGEFKKVIADVPRDWESRDDLRRYIAFIKEPATAQDVMREIELKDGVDFIQAVGGVLYMSTVLSGLTRSKFTRLITKKIYKDITIRSYSTSKKLLELMEEG